MKLGGLLSAHAVAFRSRETGKQALAGIIIMWGLLSNRKKHVTPGETTGLQLPQLRWGLLGISEVEGGGAIV